MKTRTFSFIAALATLAAFALTTAFAAPQVKQAYAHPVRSVERFGNTAVIPGSSISDVLKSLGAPHRKLSADVWAYTNFHGGAAQRPDDDCSTLLVTFVQGRVSDLRLVNDRAEKIVAARLQTKSTDKIQVAAK